MTTQGKTLWTGEANGSSLWTRVGWLSLLAGVLCLAGCGSPENTGPTAAPQSGGDKQPTSAPQFSGPLGTDGYQQRWAYIGAKLGDDKGCESFIANLELAAANRCTHILMPEGRWMRWPDDPAYLARVQKIKALAQDLHLTIVPAVTSVGYSGRYFHYDANLAAGLPVKDLLYTIKDGRGTPASSENPPNPAFTTDERGVQHAELQVKPFHHYRIWLTVAPLAGETPEVEIEGKSLNGKRNNILTNAKQVQVTDPANTWVTTFNSLNADKIKLAITLKGVKFQSFKIECAGMLLIVRRPLVPLTVTSADGQTVYEEGRDFEKIIDPCLKKNPYDGETTNDHAPADLILTPDSRIKNGDQVKLSFWHTVRIYDDQDCISLEDPRTFEIYENEFKNCQQVWGAPAYFLNYDEIRIGGWEPRPDGRALKPGELLAEHFKKNYDMVRKHAPQATLYTWSDMFTPYHNARPFAEKGYYYLVNGNYDNAWLGVPKDVVIFNWYAPKPEGVRFFADLGYQQVLCGYYDVKNTAKLIEGIERWKTVSAGQPGILGFMYTTWQSNYKLLPEFFQLLDARRQTVADGDGVLTPTAEPGVKE